MKQRRYVIYDVFTDSVLSGNPLAVVFDTDGLDAERMQGIAAEFNLSETAFVMAPDNPVHTARVRIFMPRGELPFAGHPTVGTAIALFEDDAHPGDRETPAVIVLEEEIGAVRCAVAGDGGAAFAEFDLPQLPQPRAASIQPEMLAAALGLDVGDIGFENHVPGGWTAGVPYIAIPVSGLEAAGRARLDPAMWVEIASQGGGVPGAYVYCRETVNADCAFHARMFAPHDGIPEDPATGSAAAAFAGAILRFDEPVDGPSQVWIEQGVEMGRLSRIRLEIDVEGGAMRAGRIGGHAVRVAEGTLTV